ncbi:hypothetical protein OH77DRAFT_1421209 [Trametes cingulata]|nr:hypothetical protein OH77DRAFT_1421209 [Trametes cingulata]
MPPEHFLRKATVPGPVQVAQDASGCGQAPGPPWQARDGPPTRDDAATHGSSTVIRPPEAPHEPALRYSAPRRPLPGSPTGQHRADQQPAFLRRSSKLPLDPASGIMRARHAPRIQRPQVQVRDGK